MPASTYTVIVALAGNAAVGVNEYRYGSIVMTVPGIATLLDSRRNVVELTPDTGSLNWIVTTCEVGTFEAPLTGSVMNSCGGVVSASGGGASIGRGESIRASTAQTVVADVPLRWQMPSGAQK